MGDAGPALGLVLLLAALCLINPAGYVGGGEDDARYITTAMAWAHGDWSVPVNHWQARWPAILPTALAFEWWGIERWVASLWPFVAACTALLLYWRLARHLARPAEAWLAAALLVLVPEVARRALMPSVELVELAALAGGGLAVARYVQHRRWSALALAGLAFGLAFQVRETAIVPAGLIGAWLLWSPHRPSWRDSALGLLAFLAPLAVEAIAYAAITGDPLWRRHLALAHTAIPTSELPAGVEPSGSPFFNRDLIANWKTLPGVKLHWLVNGPLNLAINALAGVGLLSLAACYPVARGRMEAPDRAKVHGLALFAAGHIAILTYVLSLDPDARIMIPALAATALALALCLGALWRSGSRPLAITLVGVAAMLALLANSIWPSARRHEAALSAYLAAHAGSVEIDRNTRLILAFVPEAQRARAVGSGGRELLIALPIGCERLRTNPALGPALVTRREMPLSSPLVSLPSGDRWTLCLFKKRRNVSRAELGFKTRE